MSQLSKETKGRRRSEVRNAPSLAALYVLAKRWGHKPEWAEKLHNARQAKQERKKPAGMPPAYFLTGSEVTGWSGL